MVKIQQNNVFLLMYCICNKRYAYNSKKEMG